MYVLRLRKFIGRLTSVDYGVALLAEAFGLSLTTKSVSAIVASDNNEAGGVTFDNPLGTTTS